MVTMTFKRRLSIYTNTYRRYFCNKMVLQWCYSCYNLQ